MEGGERSQHTLKYLYLLLEAFRINWISCLVCSGMLPKCRGAINWLKKKKNHKRVDKHFTVLLGKAMLNLVEFLR